jgi:hypothetical protein
MRAQHNPHGLNVGAYKTTRPAKAVFIAQRPTMHTSMSMMDKIIYSLCVCGAVAIGYMVVTLIHR